jgi:DNA-binding GntR family transcriptional regulator
MAGADNEDRASAALGSIQLKRSSTAEQLAELLREMILRGEIKPGEPLREASLAASIGVSRNTIRESIRVLAREGIVTSEMHHGAVVTKLTADDVADIFRVRRSLELAALDATALAEPEQLAGLTDAVARLTDAADDGDWSGVVDADQLFHERLVSLLGSRRLDRFFSAIQAEVRLCMSIVDRSASDTDALSAEHNELLELILGRKTQRCKDLLTGHLRDAEELIVATIDDP